MYKIADGDSGGCWPDGDGIVDSVQARSTDYV